VPPAAGPSAVGRCAHGTEDVAFVSSVSLVSSVSKLFSFWVAHRAELATLFGQHVALVAVSTLIAVALGVPLGILAARRPRLASPLMAAASIVQTIPSLAMFGFLLPVPFIGGV